MIKYNDEEKFNCADREVRMRKKVYARWVEIKKMTQKQADYEIGVMEQIAEDYRDRLEKELLL